MQRQVQVIVLRAIAHEMLGWHRHVKKWCKHRRMLRCGNPFKVKLRIKLGFADKTTTISGIQVRLKIKLGCADKTTTHS